MKHYLNKMFQTSFLYPLIIIITGVLLSTIILSILGIIDLDIFLEGKTVNLYEIILGLFNLVVLVIIVGKIVFQNKLRRIKQLSRKIRYTEFVDNKILQAPSYSLVTLKINNFYGIDLIDVKLEPISNWIFYTGNNAFGKSAVLRAILIGLIGNRDGNITLFEESNNVRIRLSTPEGMLENPNTNDKIKKLVCAYGPSRLVPSAISDNEFKGKSSVSYSLFNDDGLLLNILTIMPTWEIRDRDKYENTKEILLKLLPNIFKIDLTEDKKKVVFYENDEPNVAKESNNLATGNRALINMVGDIILRLSEFQTQVKNFMNLEGIVIIDEIELHLHPVHQKNMPTLLSGIFPKIQFIASTHSPIPILGAPKNTMIFNIERREGLGNICHHIQIDNIKELNPNILFTSPIFGMSEIINTDLSDMSKLRTEDSWEEMLEDESLDKDLIKMYKKTKSKK